GGMTGGGLQGLPRGGACFHPEPQLEESGLPEGADIRPEGHLDAGGESLLKARAMRACAQIDAVTQVGGEIPLGYPALLPRIGGLIRGEMRDGEGGNVPCPVRAQALHALRVHDVAVLHAVSAEACRGLHRLRARGMGHDGEAALAADREGRLELVVEQERLPVPIPRRAHDASGEIALDVMDALLDLLPDGAHEAVRPVAFPRVAGGEEVAAR